MSPIFRQRPAERAPSLRIINGRVVDPANGIDEICDLYIQDGRIAGMGKPPEDFRAVRTIDARDRIVCPGVIDAWSRLREPGATHKASIASESRAAIANGITTLCCPPDSSPIIDSSAVVKLVFERSGQAGHARVQPIGALTQGLEGQQLSQAAGLGAAGCIALSNALHPIQDTRVLRHALEYATSHGLPVVIQPLDPWLSHGGCAHEGPVAARLGLPSIPASAETAALAKALALVEETGARVHFTNLSAGRSVKMIEQARNDGLPVTAAVSAHQLYLTEMDTDAFDSQCHVIPPLRSQRDRDLLRQGVADGVIDVIQSDHQPHEADAKLAPFPSTEPGISALDTLLPLTLKLVDEGVLELERAVATLTSGPAAALGLETGSLSAGQPADICIVDGNAFHTIERELLYSQGRNTPFHGWSFSHRVTHTFVEGHLLYEADETDDTGQDPQAQ